MRALCIRDEALISDKLKKKLTPQRRHYWQFSDFPLALTKGFLVFYFPYSGEERIGGNLTSASLLRACVLDI
jgi:hypothetical protein